MTNHVDHAAARRKTSARADRIGLHVPTITSEPIVDLASQLSVGGKLVHRRTHRCIATCNMIADLAGLGQPVEVR